MPDQAARSEAVIVVHFPAKGVNQRAERKRTVDAATGDDDIGTGIERNRNRFRTQIGVGGQHFLRDGLARLPLARALGTKRIQHGQQIITLHHRHLERETRLRNQLLERPLAGLRVDAPGIRHHTHPAPGNVGEMGAQVADHVGWIAGLGIFQPRPGKERHGDLGEVIHHQHIDTRRKKRSDSDRTVAPSARGTTDAKHIAPATRDRASG